MIRKQLAERRILQRQIKLAREKQQQKLQELNRDVAQAMKLGRVPEGSPIKRVFARAGAILAAVIAAQILLRNQRKETP